MSSGIKPLWVGLAVGLVLLVAAAPATVRAERGVGVNVGRIDINDKLKPGGLYNLPVIGVRNTGTEPSEYEVVISHFQGQSDRVPPERWFSPQPRRFALQPEQVENVKIQMTLPTKAPPGRYFGLIEAHLVNEGGATVGAAAAAELSFTVTPSSWLAAQRLRINREIDRLEPWSYLVPAAALLLFAMVAVRRNFRVGVRVERR